MSVLRDAKPSNRKVTIPNHFEDRENPSHDDAVTNIAHAPNKPLIRDKSPMGTRTVPILKTIERMHPLNEESVADTNRDEGTPEQTQHVEETAYMPAPLPPPPVPTFSEADRAKLDAEVAAYRDDAMHRLEADLEDHREQVLAQIEQEKRRILDEAYHQGFDKGKEEAEEEFTAKSKELMATIQELMTVKDNIHAQSEPEILKISVAIAEQILHNELSLNSAVILNVVKESLQRITDKDKVIIRLNPVDANFIRSQNNALEQYTKDIKNLVIQDDESVLQGGCVIETKLGYIDSSIKTKLINIEKALLDTHQDIVSESTLPPAPAPSAPPAPALDLHQDETPPLPPSEHPDDDEDETSMATPEMTDAETDDGDDLFDLDDDNELEDDDTWM